MKNTTNLSEQEILRREKKNQIEEMGINPYPNSSFFSTTNTKEILEKYDKNPDKFKEISISGRLMSKRIMGSASFAQIKDQYGKIQIYMHRDTICPDEDKTMYNMVFKKLIDLGDILGIKGYVFKTKVGEISIHVQEFILLSKSIKPLPIVKEKDDQVYDLFTDPEQRYRQRYVDLIVNPHIKDIFVKRAVIIKEIRNYFDDLNCLEVETPILQPIYGGALAKPFVTHHNTLDIDLYLRIAPELYLKRLIAGDIQGVYEIGKAFRNEGMSRFHNPEFTIFEAYVGYRDYYWMMEKIEELIEKIAIKINDNTEIVNADGDKINFKRPWKKYTLYEVIKKYTDIDISNLDKKELLEVCLKLDLKIDPNMQKAKLIDEIFGQKCEPNLIDPTFVIDYPVEMSPLAKKHRDNPKLTERFEIICNGKEISNSYTELNDPLDQKQRFLNQLDEKKFGNQETMAYDHDFIRSLEYGMPPTVGIGIGIDRLTMIMTKSASIQEVILFPQMKPEK